MKKNFCAVPFTTLIINADGKVGCCREKGSEHMIGNAFEQSLEEIWNGDEIKKWRREFLDGNIQTCKKELHDKACNLMKYNLELMPFVEYSEHQSNPFLKLSPDINGECNLKCPMCIIWKKPNGKYDQIPNFWENLEANVLPHLKIMDPLAGEPFIQDDLYKIIRMTAKVNPECRWNFTTNGHWTMTQYIADHLDMIKINLISISLDSVDHTTYSKIRKGGDLQTVKRNIAALIDYVNDREKRTGEKVKLVLNFTIQQQNSYQLNEMFDYCDTVGIAPMIQMVYKPEALSVERWNEKQKVDYLKHYLTNMDKNRLLICNRIFMAVIRNIEDEKTQKRYYQLYNLITEGQLEAFVKLSENPLEFLKELNQNTPEAQL